MVFYNFLFDIWLLNKRILTRVVGFESIWDSRTLYDLKLSRQFY